MASRTSYPSPSGLQFTDIDPGRLCAPLPAAKPAQDATGPDLSPGQVPKATIPTAVLAAATSLALAFTLGAASGFFLRPFAGI